MGEVQKHTPEPWKLSDNINKELDSDGWWFISAESQTYLAEVQSYRYSGEDASAEFKEAEANAERIVACVNAMQDITYPSEFVAGAVKQYRELNRLRETSIEIVITAKRLIDSLDEMVTAFEFNPCKTHEQIEAINNANELRHSIRESLGADKEAGSDG